MKFEVKNSKLRKLDVDTKGGSFTLVPVDEIPLSELDTVSNAIDYIEKHFRLETKESSQNDEDKGFSWTDDELIALFDDTTSDGQKIFFRVLARNPEAPTKIEILKALEDEGYGVEKHSLDGILSSITRRAKHFGRKEPIFDTKWNGTKDCWMYPVKKQYQEVLQNYWDKA